MSARSRDSYIHLFSWFFKFQTKETINLLRRISPLPTGLPMVAKYSHLSVAIDMKYLFLFQNIYALIEIIACFLSMLCFFIFFSVQGYYKIISSPTFKNTTKKREWLQFSAFKTIQNNVLGNGLGVFRRR